MQYLVLHNNKAFYTNWYNYENNYNDGMVVFSLLTDTYTTDGINWEEIEEDHL